MFPLADTSLNIVGPITVKYPDTSTLRADISKNLALFVTVRVFKVVGPDTVRYPDTSRLFADISIPLKDDLQTIPNPVEVNI
jgi:hypothetical protein